VDKHISCLLCHIKFYTYLIQFNIWLYISDRSFKLRPTDIKYCLYITFAAAFLASGLVNSFHEPTHTISIEYRRLELLQWRL